MLTLFSKSVVEKPTTIAGQMRVGVVFKTADYSGDSWYMRIHPNASMREQMDEIPTGAVLVVDLKKGIFYPLSGLTPVIPATNISLAIS